MVSARGLAPLSSYPCWAYKLSSVNTSDATVRNVSGPYRFFFYSFDCNEPMHVHARREGMTCKFWLEPIALSENHGFSPNELNRIRRMVQSTIDRIIKAWYEHCG